jgi:flagellar biosynthesis regulator FlaF
VDQRRWLRFQGTLDRSSNDLNMTLRAQDILVFSIFCY